MEEGFKSLQSENEALLNQALELHHLLKGLAGRPLSLPPVVARLHNPPPPVPTVSYSTPRLVASGGSGVRERRLITKAAAKMITDHPGDHNQSRFF